MTTPVVPVLEPSKAKTWVGLVGSILTFLVPLVTSSLDYLPPQWAGVIGGVLAILTALGIYRAPYKPSETTIVANSDIPAINAGTALVPEAPLPPVVAPYRPGEYRNPWG